MITNIKHWKQIKESLDQASQNAEELLLLKKDLDKDNIEKLDGKDWQIVSLIGVVQDPKDIAKYDTAFENSANVSTDLQVKKVKTGDTLYLTVLLQPRNQSLAYSAGEIGVIQVKIQQIFYGTAKLNQLKQAGKLFN